MIDNGKINQKQSIWWKILIIHFIFMIDNVIEGSFLLKKKATNVLYIYLGKYDQLIWIDSLKGYYSYSASSLNITFYIIS